MQRHHSIICVYLLSQVGRRDRYDRPCWEAMDKECRLTKLTICHYINKGV